MNRSPDRVPRVSAGSHAMGRGVSNVQREAEDDVARLQRCVAELLALAEETLTDRIQFDQNNHLLFLVLLFTAKQAEPSRAGE